MAEPATDRSARLAELLARTALSDQAAFADLYRLTASHLYGVAVRILREPAVAEDMLQEAFVRVWHHAGSYNSASEVVREALRLMEQNDELRTIQLQELRKRIDNGLAQAERGESVDGEVFMQGLLKDLDTRVSKRKAG